MIVFVLATSTIPSWMQGIAAIVSALLTLLTLIVLLRYADDTKRIADISASQTEISQMPFLVVTMREGTPNLRAGWIIHNQGEGSALNIFHSAHDGQGNKSMHPMPPLGKGGVRENLHDVIANGLAHGEFEMRYESLSGLKYRTTVKTVEGAAQIQFHRPNITASSNSMRAVIKRLWQSF